MYAPAVERGRSRPLVALVLALALWLAPSPAGAADGQITLAVHVSLAPTWFDPAETPGVITPFLTLYALHDALVKPMPGNAWAPCLAESWTQSKDGLTYEFVLRKGVRFHNGDPLTAEDVKFSFERYKGAAATTLKAHVAAVEVVDAHRVRFRLKQPWPDFMTFYATPASGAAWIVPKAYTERVGEDGFKRAPVGAGPYRFVSFSPGVELVVEAHDGYWRKAPAVKRLVFKVVPDESTRLAMLKRAEADVAYTLRGPLGEEVRRTPGLTLKVTVPDLHGVARVHPAVGSEVTVGRPPGAPRGQPGHRPQDPEPGGVPRIRQGGLEHHPPRLRLLLVAARVPARPGAGEAAPGRGRLPEGLRRGRGRDRRGLRARSRGGHQRAPGHRHPRHACARWSGPPSTRRIRTSSSST